MLLTRRERGRSVLLLLTIFLNSFVEILGLALIVPVIGLVIRPETIEKEWYLLKAFTLSSCIGIETPSEFLILLCFILVSAFLLKAIFGLGVSLFQTRFSYSVALRISGMMWTYHYEQSLQKMRSTQSGQILSEINSWPRQFAQFFMIGGLLILSEGIVVGLIAAGLLAYNPLVFLSILVLIGTGAVLVGKLTQKRLSSYSNTRSRLEPKTNSLITDSIQGFLEVITFKASSSIRNAYLKDRWRIFRIQSNTNVLNLVPAKLYEVLAVSAISASIILAIIQGTPQGGFLKLLTFMAISAYRIMPSMSRINVAVMQMRSQAHVLDTIEGASNVLKSRTSKRASKAVFYKDTIDIELQNVVLKYEASETPIINGVTTSFRHGKIHGIVGPSGSGKSTLINSLLGLHSPSKGRIQLLSENKTALVLGKDCSMKAWLETVGYLSQKPFLFHGTVAENLTMRVEGAKIDHARVHGLIDVLELEQCFGAKPLEFIIEEGGNNLSGGQQQRLALLRALQLERPVLILDEATSALDHKLSEVVFNLLRKRAEAGCNIILITHNSEIAGKCDTVLKLKA